MMVTNLVDNSYDSDIQIIKCKEVTDCFVVNDTYSELLNRKISINELNNYPLILQTKGSNTRIFLDNFAKDNDIILKPNIELASYSLVVEFAYNKH